MRPRRRILHPVPGLGAEDCHDTYGAVCPSPPAPSSIFYADPYPSPLPSPSLPPPCPPVPVPAPAPSPVHGGRRDQGGTHGYSPPPPGGDQHSRRLVTSVLVAAAVLAFVSLILLGVSVAVRRRQVRRRRQALLAPAGPAAAAGVDDGGNDPEGGGGGGVVHHIWYIRTVGLDEASINSIAVTRYHAGAGLLGAADCSVCLGEFQDGELVRLLPRCAHAFHVPCIDTWLRAHVNCPVCRSDVLEPAVTTASGDGGGGESSSDPPADPVANANAAAEQTAAASDPTSEHEEEEESRDQQPSSVQNDQREQPSSPEPPPPPQLPCPLPRDVRRAASMDAAIVSAAAAVAARERLPETAPEEEQSGRPKRGAGPSWIKASASGGAPRSFFSRHCRARSSVLPL